MSFTVVEWNINRAIGLLLFHRHRIYILKDLLQHSNLDIFMLGPIVLHIIVTELSFPQVAVVWVWLVWQMYENLLSVSIPVSLLCTLAGFEQQEISEIIGINLIFKEIQLYGVLSHLVLSKYYEIIGEIKNCENKIVYKRKLYFGYYYFINFIQVILLNFFGYTA